MSLYPLSNMDTRSPDGITQSSRVTVRQVWGTKGREEPVLTVTEDPLGKVTVTIHADVTFRFEPEPREEAPE